MKPEDRLLLICLRQDFKGEHVQAVRDLTTSMKLDWDRIARTAKQHGVSGLIFHNLDICQENGLSLPEKSFQILKLSAYRNALVKEKQKERLIRALAFFKEHNLEVMLIKGAALDLCVYDDPYYVISDDIDIILHAKKDDLTLETRRAIANYLDGQGIEFDYYSHHDVNINSLLPINFSSIWDRSVSMNFHDFIVKVMSTTDLFLSLCINSSRKKYFRLKSLCDISETIQKHQDIQWQSVVERAFSFRCQNIVYTALLLTERLTKSELPPDWNRYFEISKVKRSLINQTVSWLTEKISFYPYPYSNISIFGRPFHFSMVLPYIVNSGSQVGGKISFAFQNWDYKKIKFKP